MTLRGVWSCTCDPEDRRPARRRKGHDWQHPVGVSTADGVLRRSSRTGALLLDDLAPDLAASMRGGVHVHVDVAVVEQHLEGVTGDCPIED